MDDNHEVGLVVDTAGKVVNRIVLDPNDIPALGGDERIIRGLDANIGDTIDVYNNVHKAPEQEPEVDPMEQLSRDFDAAKTIKAIKQVIQAHPLFGYIPAPVSEVTEVNDDAQ